MQSQFLPILRATQLSAGMVLTLVAFGLISVLTLVTARKDYADMHIMLDTGIFLLPGVLALLFWDMGIRTQSPFPKWLALSFGFAAALAFVHALVGVEWPIAFVSVNEAQNVLRPTTWPPPGQLLPIGIGAAIWLKRRGMKSVWPELLLLVSVTPLLYVVFSSLPLYTAPILGISRPTLILAPLLWCTVGWMAWRSRHRERLMTPLALMSEMLAVANVFMLYSRTPHDSLAIVAHLGLVCGYLLLFLAITQMFSTEMLERSRVEQELGQLNKELEARVLHRTAELAETNESLMAEIAERRKTEVALRESQERLESTLQGGGIGTWTYDIATNQSWLDDSLLKILGRSRNQLNRPDAFYRFVHPADRATAQRAFQAAIAEGRNHHSEFRYIKPDGAVISLESRGRPDKDASGNTLRMIGCCLDVTERKRAEEAQLRLGAIVESSDDAIISKTLDGIICTWNRGAEKLFGYSAEEAVGKPMQMLIPSERSAEEPDILRRLAKGESVDHFETVRITKGGQMIHVSTTISPIRNDSGEIIGASKIARDISERRQAEIRLRAQLVRLDLLQQITRSIGERQDLMSIFQVVVRRLEEELPIDFGCLCLYDPISETLTVTCVGVRSNELAIQMAMPEQSSISIDENGLGRCVRGQLVYEPDLCEEGFPFPQRLARADLRSLVIAPLRVESKTFGVLVAARKEANSFSSGDCEFLRQLTEHVALAAHQAQLYSALQQAYDDLRSTQQAVMQQERLRAVGQMASGIAHDINNALAPMSLYVESILESDTNLSERSRDSLKIVERAIDDVAATVARLREFYRQREPEMTLAQIDLNAVAQQSVDLTRARWRDLAQQQNSGIDLVVDLAGDLPSIMGAESEIREALINLIFNALDAMPNGGTLTVRTIASSSDLPSERYVHLEITDTGIGMDDQTRRRCLEPFFTTKGERGTGLGLAMVYGMAERHSTDVEIESTIGQGTTVRLTFPVAATMTPESNPQLSTANLVQKQRILLVDDDPLVLKSLREALEKDGHIVLAANGGGEGIEAFHSAKESGEAFSVVITDLGMPYVDGRQVANSIKQISSETPVILLTGWGQRLVADGDVPAHVDHVLNKPPKLRELREALVSVCNIASD